MKSRCVRIVDCGWWVLLMSVRYVAKRMDGTGMRMRDHVVRVLCVLVL